MEQPNAYLFGWPEIMTALKLDDNQTNRRRLQRLNGSQVGPIRCVGRGSPPRVELSNLIGWWNELDARWQEIAQRSIDKRESVASRHEYGRHGVVYPEIKGHERKR